MSDFGEAIGTAAEGGLFAKAVSGRAVSADGASAGGGAHSGTTDGSGHFAENACLNCGFALTGPYCSECGQKAHLHRTLGAFMHDLLHGALHFEGRMWSTLPKLVLRPGELTRRYIAGERARFVSPMALFLFSVFLMFAVFQAVGISAPTDIQQVGSEARAQAVEAKTLAVEQRDALPADDAAGRAQLDERIEGLDIAIAAIDAGENYDFSDKDGNRTWQEINVTGIDFIDHGIVAKWRKNPGLMLYKLQANSYKFSWLLIPLSIPFVWLLFAWKRRFRAYDHAIFVTYSLSFMSLLFLVGSVLG